MSPQKMAPHIFLLPATVISAKIAKQGWIAFMIDREHVEIDLDGSSQVLGPAVSLAVGTDKQQVLERALQVAQERVT